MAIISYSPWQDAANVGAGIGGSIAQVLLQVPMIKRQIANEERKLAIEEIRLQQRGDYEQQRLQLEQGKVMSGVLRDVSQVKRWNEQSAAENKRTDIAQTGAQLKGISDLYGMVVQGKKLKQDVIEATNLKEYRDRMAGVAEAEARTAEGRAKVYAEEYPKQNQLERANLQLKRTELEARNKFLPESDRVPIPEFQFDKPQAQSQVQQTGGPIRPIDPKLKATAAVATMLMHQLGRQRGNPRGGLLQVPAAPQGGGGAPTPQSQAPAVLPPIQEGQIPPEGFRWKVRNVKTGQVMWTDTNPELLSAEFEEVK